MDELCALVHSIPPGRVASYGTIGAHLTHPTTGRIVGRWMAQCQEDIPWWRVVAKSGMLPIEKRDPTLGHLQQDLLLKEGVEVVDGVIDMPRFAI